MYNKIKTYVEKIKKADERLASNVESLLGGIVFYEKDLSKTTEEEEYFYYLGNVMFLQSIILTLTNLNLEEMDVNNLKNFTEGVLNSCFDFSNNEIELPNKSEITEKNFLKAFELEKPL